MTDHLFTETLRAAVGDDLLTRRLSEEVVFADLGAETVRPLLDFTALSDLLTTHTLEPPRLRLHSAGSPVPAERYTEPGTASPAGRGTIRPEALYRELRDGASLVLDSVDRLHPPVRAAADDLMRMVRERAQANLYLIWGDSYGFDTHWDDHDTFVVQLAGTKSWQVHGQGDRRNPMKEDTDHRHGPPGGTVWEGTLRPGHVLHVPRGWWHTVSGTGDVSMHLTFGFTRTTGIDWVASVLERLHEDEFLRADIPRFSSAQERHEHHRELLRRLTETAERHGIDGLLNERAARFPRRQSFALPWAVDGSEPEEHTVAEFVPVVCPPLERGGTSVALSVSGRRYRFPARVEPVLSELVEQRSLTAGELAERSGCSLDTTAEVLRVLVRNHLVLLR
ncbi:cupin superfamily protein [Haloactinospora alba]|uniref:Cupin superfamily protein n=1 Tax=Haloactinospora alba TaxID=405555 RepID=A0A543NJ45_9ACTN|nr:cupin domain-containing protein [Haloactinospora alba]TQN31859.1 cupin superfamily protein [Haloactinospora alba]